MSLTMADRWYRIDKGDGAITPVLGDVVELAARNHFETPDDAIASGRFQTPFAFYSDQASLSAEECMQRIRAIVPEQREALGLFTFTLTTGRKVTYAAPTAPAARLKAIGYHGDEARAGASSRASRCECPEKSARSARQAGFLICDRAQCAGYIA